MPTSSSQSWPRGFSPLFRDPQAGQHLRVSDAERQAVADRLGEHYADGRLDQAEFDERVGRAMSAKTRADLSGLFDDLPEPVGPPNAGSPDPGAPVTGASGLGGPGTGTMPRRLPHRHHPVLVIALAVVVALAVVHTVPWLWIGFFVAVMFLARRGRRHSHYPSHHNSYHPSQDR